MFGILISPFKKAITRSWLLPDPPTIQELVIFMLWKALPSLSILRKIDLLHSETRSVGLLNE